MYQPSVAIDGFTFTEAPRWHLGRIWFVDMFVNRVCSAAEDGTDPRTECEVPGVPLGLGWLPDGRLLVVSKVLQSIMRREADGSLVTHAELASFLKDDTDLANDMVVASDGTAYVGSYGFDNDGGAPLDTSVLLRVTPDGEVSVAAEPVYFPNGATIIGSSTLVVAESFGNRLSAFDIEADGTLSKRRDWARFGSVVPSGTPKSAAFDQVVVAPDGISRVDAEGAIWAADFNQNRVVRVQPGGAIVDEVRVAPHLRCYATELGGSDGRTLFICATPLDFDPNTCRDEPGASIQTCRVDVPVA